MFEEDFKNYMASFELVVPNLKIFIDGSIHRFGTIYDKGKKPCWYMLNLVSNHKVYGAFGCWKRSICETWSSHNLKQLSSKEKELINKKQQQFEKDKLENQQKAQKYAQKIWEESSTENVTDHPYLVKKGIKNRNARLYKKLLVIPLYNAKKELCSLQFISSEGNKTFLKHSLIKGSYHSIGELTKTLYICEGFATGLTIYEAMQKSIVVAFNANNLLPVAKVIRKKYPNHEIIICTDNDQWTVNNIGVIKGQEAAQAIGAKLITPQFKDIGTKPTDFNDLMQLGGLKEVKRQLDNNITKSKESDDDIVKRLAKLSQLEYDKVREKEAKKLGVRVSTLDDEVNKIRKQDQGDSNNLGELENGIEPWPEPVNGDNISNEIKNLLLQHLVITDAQCTAIALWIIGTYCFDAFGIFPKLLINSPTKRCGKSTLLELLNCLVHKSLSSSNITPAAMFRSIEKWHPTILVDEADSFLRNNEELRGIINSSHKRTNAYVLRVEGDASKREPKKFSTWSPMAIAMIGKPPDTVMDRSIVVSLKRKLTSEKVRKLPIDSDKKYISTRRKLKRWADDNFETIKFITPAIPDINNDRFIDNYFPLFAIADLLGGDWRLWLENSIRNFASCDTEENTSILLLGDIKNIFENLQTDKIHSDKLAEELNALEASPWREWKHGKPLTTNSLSRLLKPFGIKSSQLWYNGHNKNGYQLTDFQDAFTRYLSNTPIQNSKTLEPNTVKAYSDFQNSRAKSSLEFQNCSKPNASKESRVLEFQKGVHEDIQADHEVFAL